MIYRTVSWAEVRPWMLIVTFSPNGFAVVLPSPTAPSTVYLGHPNGHVEVIDRPPDNWKTMIAEPEFVDAITNLQRHFTIEDVT